MHWLLLAQVAAPAVPVVVESPLPTIVKVLLGVLSAVAAIVGAALTAFLLERSKSSKTFRVFAVANTTMQAAIAKVKADLQPELEKDLADGKLDADELRALKAKAWVSFKAEMGDKGLATVQSIVSVVVPTGAETFVKGLLEQGWTGLFGGKTVTVVDVAPKLPETEAAMAAAVAKASGYVAERAADGSVVAVKVNPSMPHAEK
jgi:hypothetical protein